MHYVLRHSNATEIGWSVDSIVVLAKLRSTPAPQSRRQGTEYRTTCSTRRNSNRGPAPHSWTLEHTWGKQNGANVWCFLGAGNDAVDSCGKPSLTFLMGSCGFNQDMQPEEPRHSPHMVKRWSVGLFGIVIGQGRTVSPHITVIQPVMAQI